VIEGAAHDLLRTRDRIDADVAICADVNVKHATPLDDRSVGTAASDAVGRGGADAVIVSGEGTGSATDAADLRAAREAVGDAVPILVGSGATPATLPDLLDPADGAIVGTALKADGETTAPVDRERAEHVVAAARSE
jgi:membrane complex biogenesis BtpA family protein